MSFSDLVNGFIFDADPIVDGVCFNELSQSDRRQLVEAWIDENPEDLTEVLIRVPGYQHALARFAGPGDADTYDFRNDFRVSAEGFYADLIQDELDTAFREFCKERGIYTGPDYEPADLVGFAS